MPTFIQRAGAIFALGFCDGLFDLLLSIGLDCISFAFGKPISLDDFGAGFSNTIPSEFGHFQLIGNVASVVVLTMTRKAKQLSNDQLGAARRFGRARLLQKRRRCRPPNRFRPIETPGIPYPSARFTKSETGVLAFPSVSNRQIGYQPRQRRWANFQQQPDSSLREMRRLRFRRLPKSHRRQNRYRHEISWQ